MYFQSVCAFVGAGLLAGSANAALSQQSNWKNVRIGGGGGFIPGIVFNPSEKGLAYARADMGGAYRLNSDDTWTPLMDGANDTTWHNWGIDALATDPVDTPRVYAAVGMYTNSWDPKVGSILRSKDKGNTWDETVLPFKVGGNMPGRGIGERLAVDPNSNNVLYFGARSGHGLWKSTDFGVTWSNVTSFKWTGTYFQDATSTLTSDPIGIAWITFDSTSGKSGAATPRIFVGVVDVGQSVFKSEDGGVTWSWVSGEPMYGFLPHKGVLDPAQKLLYVSYANGAGPYDGTNGTLNKYNITSGTWTDITPTPFASTSYGYGGIAVDLQKPGTLMVSALNSWWPDGNIFRSTDSGATWSPLWAWNGYPNLNLFYKYDISAAGWLQDSTSTNQFLMKVGWMMEALVIDPFDSNHWLYGTGATIYGGRDLTKWDTVHNVTLASMATGIEETAVLGLIVPPGGPALLSAVGDIGGFYHDSLDVARPQAFHTPTYGSTQDIDYAGNKPTNIVRSGSSSTDAQVAVSFNFGVSWNGYSGAANSVGPGKVAISADADTILLMSSTGGVMVSKNVATFSAVASLPSGAAIASDKRNNSMFYGGSAGSFYASSNGGTTFTKTTALGSATYVNAIKVHPSIAGDVWASTDVGLFHSTNFGTTFTQAASVSAGWSFAFGAPAIASSYPTIFGFFTVSGLTTLYKSEDQGASWVVISDASHGFGSGSANVVAADMAKYGRVYVGTNGRGIFYGDAVGSAPISSSSASTSKSTLITSVTSTRVVSTSSVSSTRSTLITSVTSTRVLSTSTTATSTTSKTSTTSTATAGAYGQCGGIGWSGATGCPAGWSCKFSNAYYSQCLQG